MILHLLNIAVLTAILSAAGSVLIVLSQRWHGKLTLDHDLSGVQKFHTTAVPRIGGIAIAGAIFLTLLIADFAPAHSPVSSSAAPMGLLLLAALPTFVAGIVEDMTKVVSVRVRLAASVASALTASWLLGATIDELDIWGVDALLNWLPFALLITAITVAGGVNAINIIDGFNGLASSTVMIMLAALGIIAWQVNDAFIAQLAMLGLGAALGFFLVNYPKGRIFLGDGGAYFLGFWVAEVTVLLLVRNASVTAWQLLAICGYPLIEVMYSMYRRRVIRQKSPGAPDALHLHTLVYRRIVPRFVSPTAAAWKRNATVLCCMLPWIVCASFSGVWVGTNMAAAIACVVLQLFVYLAAYTRIVRGRWGRKSVSKAMARRVEPGLL